MRNVYLFNPEHDMALADGNSHYLPVKAVKKMADDLSALPAWWASDDDVVCVSSVSDTLMMAEEYKDFMPKVAWSSLSVLAPQVDRAIPWGWDAAVCRIFRCWGIDQSLLPDDERMATIRRLSGRATAVEALSQLRRRFPEEGFCGDSRLCQDLAGLRDAIEGMDKTILKAPWSSSGKGLRWGNGVFDRELDSWCRSVLRKQGAVVVEPLYNKVCDFAMEFYCDGMGHVEFLGYSLFETNVQGTYDGNVLAGDDEIVRRLNGFWHSDGIHDPAPEWSLIQKGVSSVLEGLIGHEYVGHLGVDMMICRGDDHRLTVHPCVEINLRMNMGIVSHIIYERYVCPQVQGKYKIQSFMSGLELNQWHDMMRGEHPIEWENGRIKKGYLSLTPVGKDTRYLAYILIL